MIDNLTIRRARPPWLEWWGRGLDDEVRVAPAVFQEIEELSRLMGLEQRYWERLRNQVRTTLTGGEPDPSDGS
jgi:hypothetical protein